MSFVDGYSGHRRSFGGLEKQQNANGLTRSRSFDHASSQTVSNPDLGAAASPTSVVDGAAEEKLAAVGREAQALQEAAIQLEQQSAEQQSSPVTQPAVSLSPGVTAEELKQGEYEASKQAFPAVGLGPFGDAEEKSSAAGAGAGAGAGVEPPVQPGWPDSLMALPEFREFLDVMLDEDAKKGGNKVLPDGADISLEKITGLVYPILDEHNKLLDDKLDHLQKHLKIITEALVKVLGLDGPWQNNDSQLELLLGFLENELRVNEPSGDSVFNRKYPYWPLTKLLREEVQDFQDDRNRLKNEVIALEKRVSQIQLEDQPCEVDTGMQLQAAELGGRLNVDFLKIAIDKWKITPPTPKSVLALRNRYIQVLSFHMKFPGFEKAILDYIFSSSLGLKRIEGLLHLDSQLSDPGERFAQVVERLNQLEEYGLIHVPTRVDDAELNRAKLFTIRTRCKEDIPRLEARKAELEAQLATKVRAATMFTAAFRGHKVRIQAQAKLEKAVNDAVLDLLKPVYDHIDSEIKICQRALNQEVTQEGEMANFVETTLAAAGTPNASRVEARLRGLCEKRQALQAVADGAVGYFKNSGTFQQWEQTISINTTVNQSIADPSFLGPIRKWVSQFLHFLNIRSYGTERKVAAAFKDEATNHGRIQALQDAVKAIQPPGVGAGG